MDVVVTVPKGMWWRWIEEGDLPDSPEPDTESHFWSGGRSPFHLTRGDRVYIVAHGKLRGYALLERFEGRCQLRPDRMCFVRRGGTAVPVTIDQEIKGFQGWRYRWWERGDERPCPDWQKI